MAKKTDEQTQPQTPQPNPNPLAYQQPKPPPSQDAPKNELIERIDLDPEHPRHMTPEEQDRDLDQKRQREARERRESMPKAKLVATDGLEFVGPDGKRQRIERDQEIGDKLPPETIKQLKERGFVKASL